MNPLNLNNSVSIIIKDIQEYEQNVKAGEPEAKSVSAKVEEFVKSNIAIISPAQQKTITNLLGGLTDLKTKASSCQQLASLIKTISTAIQPETHLSAERILLKACEEEDNKIAATLIDRFNSLTNQSERVQNIKHVIKKTPNKGKEADQFLQKLLKNFDLFKIADEQDRVDIAKMIPFTEGNCLAENIQKFQIANEKSRFEIAKRAVKTPFKGFAIHIDNFNLEEGYRYEIANEDDYGVTSNSYYKLSEKHRIALGKKLAVERTSEINNLMPSLNITDEEERFKIAKIALERSPIELRNEGIQGFDLSEEHNFEIAKSLAAFYPESIVKYIEGLNLKNSKNILNLVLFIFEEYKYSRVPQSICENIERFGLSEEERYEVAKSIIQTREKLNVLEHIKNFQLTYEHRFEIAKQCFPTINSSWRLTAIPNFNLTPKDRLELAWTCARNVPISWCIQSFTLPDEKDRLALALYEASRAGKDTILNLKNYKLNSDFPLILLNALRSSPDEARAITNKCLPLIPSPESISKCFDGLVDTIEKSKNDAVQEWWRAFRTIFTGHVVNEHEKYVPYAEQISKHENPATRYLLTKVMYQYGVPAQSDAVAEHTVLFRLVAEPLLKSIQFKTEDLDKMWKVLGNKEYRDGSKKDKVIKGLFSLLECPDLNPEEKRLLLKQIFENDKAIPAHNALQMLDAIISSDQASMLKTIKEQTQKEVDVKSAKASDGISTFEQKVDFAKILQDIFRSCIGTEQVPDFGTKYNTTIGSSRNPTALLVYAANLSSLTGEDRQSAMNSLQEFTISVLNGTYTTLRYQAPDGSHLATIFENRERLKKAWQEGSSQTIVELYKKLDESELKNLQMQTKDSQFTAKEFDVADFLKTKICTDKHLDPNVYNNLSNCLKGVTTSKTALKNCEEALKQAKEAVNKSGITIKGLTYDPKNTLTKPIFENKMEIALITLLDTPAKKKNEHIKKLLPHLITMCGVNAPIVQDMNELQQRLEEQNKSSKSHTDEGRYDHYIIEDTDSWEDMELSGTEVMGSCQRIGGEVNYNKCLLAYMRDGKNRAIVIKDPVTKKIVARCIMRLLWNDEEKKPVLFQERLYDNPGVPERAKRAIDLLFARRARQLQIPLVRTALEKETRYKHPLESLGSPAPFEYVDAGSIGITNGTFTIPANDIHLVQ